MGELAKEIKNLLYNKVITKDNITKYRKPLVGFVEASHPGFLELRKVVTPNHLLPQQILSEAKTVIAFFIPFTQEIIKQNREGSQVAASWAEAYVETNYLIGKLCQSMHDFLAEKGYKTACLPATHNFDATTLESLWSHRSVAYLAGMGSFGINHMLITSAGCAGRFGSVVTSAELPTSKGENKEYCLYKKTGTCTYCVDNCPTGALTLEGINKQKCYAHLLQVAEGFKDLGLCDVCGKCVVGPCAINLEEE